MFEIAKRAAAARRALGTAAGLSKGDLSAARAKVLFEQQQQEIYRNTDGLFSKLMICQWLAAILMAVVISPYTWAGQSHAIHIHVWAAIFVGGAISLFPIWMTRAWPGAAITRHVIAVAQMLMSALLISVTGGRIETHFHVFGSLVILSFYRDWRVLIPATIVVGLDHFIRGVYWPYSVYGVLAASPWRSIEHAAWVVFEDIFLVISCLRNVREMRSIANRTAELETTGQVYSAILNSSLDCIITIDREGRVREFNPGAERVFGFTRAEAFGQELAELIIPARMRERHRRGMAHYIKTGEGPVIGQRIEIEALRKDGTEILVELAVTALQVDGVPLFTAYLRDITEQKQAEEALRKAEHKYREIFENAIEGIFQTTPDGKYISVNPALARMYGYDSPAELVSSVSDIGTAVYVESDRRKEFQRLIEAQGFVELFEYEVYRKDGAKIWLSENARAVRDASGAVIYYEGTVEDITEHKLVDEVKRASKAKSEFLSRMSHELRTPLNAILGFGQLLERQKPTEIQRKRVGYILSAGKHLLDLINEVLDISRIEAGRMQLSLEPVCIADALEETLDLMRPLATERSIQLSASADIDAGVHVLADRQRFKQVLVNLLNNAVKYTPFFGGVTVSYHVPGNEKVRVLVSDTGPGIPAEKLARLFTPFERLGAEQSAIEGTGLGLALSQRLMDVMGGSIGVESAVGKGSTFWIELPLTKSPLERFPRERSAANGARQPSSEPASRSILYIEDNLSNLALIEQMLAERPGTALLTSMQGKVGLDLARQHTPDLILLDLHLPDLPGWDILSQLKADSTTRHIPVVVVSADATKRQINRLMSAGAAHYLTKPLDVNKFFQVLDETNGIDSAEQSPAAAISNGDVKEACPSP